MSGRKLCKRENELAKYLFGRVNCLLEGRNKLRSNCGEEDKRKKIPLFLLGVWHALASNGCLTPQLLTKGRLKRSEGSICNLPHETNDRDPSRPRCVGPTDRIAEFRAAAVPRHQIKRTFSKWANTFGRSSRMRFSLRERRRRDLRPTNVRSVRLTIMFESSVRFRSSFCEFSLESGRTLILGKESASVHLTWRREGDARKTVPVVGKVCALKFPVELDRGVHRLDAVAGQHEALDVGVERDGDDVQVGAGRARGRPQGLVARAGVRTEAAGGGGKEAHHDGHQRRGLSRRAHASFGLASLVWRLAMQSLGAAPFFSKRLGSVPQFVLMPT